MTMGDELPKELLFDTLDYAIKLAVIGEQEHPVRLPGLEYVDRIPGALRGFLKSAKGTRLGRDLSNLMTLAEESNRIYETHRDIIVELREEYEHARLLPKPGEPSLLEKLTHRGREDPEERFISELPSRYYGMLAAHLEQDALTQYVSSIADALSLLRYKPVQRAFREGMVRVAEESGVPGAKVFIGLTVDKLIQHVNTRPDDMETAISQLRDSGHAFVGTLYARGKKDA